VRPVLAFTPGDPGGVGPEVAVAAMRDKRVRRACKPLAVGPRAVFERAGWRPALCEHLDIGPACRRVTRRPTSEGGSASYYAVKTCISLAQRGLLDGLVTAPVSKEAWRLAGVPHLDHTGLIQAATGAKRIGMWLSGGGLSTVLVTRHVPHSSVSRVLSFSKLKDAAELAQEAMRRLGRGREKMGVCALNPHASDGGLIGREEGKLLTPWVKRLRRQGLRVQGPLPADAAWLAHKTGRLGLVLSLYHDQALIPLKVHADYAIVNWTLGAPIVRTSPGHGTAYDIAGKKRAKAEGMVQAALLAARVCGKKQ
jgi:4-hydroxythreonine-4-phosphate dehydrogenase